MEYGPSIESFRDLMHIGEGSYGVVFSAIGPDNKLVAIKRELASDKATRPNLQHEYHVLKALAGHECIPKAIAYGRSGKTNALVMDLLGPSLGELCAEKVGLGATAHLALGMLDAVQYVHSQGFIHRDIKPSNFVVGCGDKSRFVCLLDFGLARRWRNVTDETSAAFHCEDRIVGSPHYVSMYTHLGQEQTRRDDLHALTYTIISLVRGNLPWSCVTRGTNKHYSQRILKKKRAWTAARLCQDLPLELQLATLTSREICGDFSFKWEGRRIPFRKTDIVPPPPSVKRGDIVLLKLNPDKTLDRESLRYFDPSFFPHQLPLPEEAFPYRPAVVRNVIVWTQDPVYFYLELYSVMRRASLEGLSKHRRSCFQQLEMVIQNATGKPVPFHDLYLYRTKRIGNIIVEYSEAASIQATTSIPDDVLTTLELQLSKGKLSDYKQVYDSDDDETRTVNKRLPVCWDETTAVMDIRPCDVADLTDGIGVNTSGCNSWNSEMTYVDEIRKQESGACDDYVDHDMELNDCSMEFCGWPLPRNRRLSCTVSIASVCGSTDSGIHLPA